MGARSEPSRARRHFRLSLAKEKMTPRGRFELPRRFPPNRLHVPEYQATRACRRKPGLATSARYLAEVAKPGRGYWEIAPNRAPEERLMGF